MDDEGLQGVVQIDNMDLLTKRIRLGEYLISPILFRFSNNTYRLLNSQNVSLKKLTGIFKSVHPDFVIRALKVLNPIQYSSSVNQHDLFSVALRMTIRGPQSAGKQHIATRSEDIMNRISEELDYVLQRFRSWGNWNTGSVRKN